VKKYQLALYTGRCRDWRKKGPGKDNGTRWLPLLFHVLFSIWQSRASPHPKAQQAQHKRRLRGRAACSLGELQHWRIIGASPSQHTRAPKLIAHTPAPSTAPEWLHTSATCTLLLTLRRPRSAVRAPQVTALEAQ